MRRPQPSEIPLVQRVYVPPKAKRLSQRPQEELLLYASCYLPFVGVYIRMSVASGASGSASR